MGTDGVMGVHDNVLFEANTAGNVGGAVSLSFEIGYHVAFGVVWVTFGKGMFDLVRRLMVVFEAL